jgi:spore maturation protein CgeB
MDKGVNFNAIYPEKQEVVKQMTGVDFTLPQIVMFLKKQTDNFEKQMPLATDIDNSIYAVYLKWKDEKATPTPSTPFSENEAVKRYLAEIEDLKVLIDIETDEKVINKYQKEIEDLQTLIELEA